jgi:hypothetical protein
LHFYLLHIIFGDYQNSVFAFVGVSLSQYVSVAPTTSCKADGKREQ